jgi:hypothetical protein
VYTNTLINFDTYLGYTCKAQSFHIWLSPRLHIMVYRYPERSLLSLSVVMMFAIEPWTFACKRLKYQPIFPKTLPRQTSKICNTIDQHVNKISNFHFLYIQNFIVYVISSPATTTLNCLKDSVQIIVFKFHRKLPRWNSVDKIF